MKKAAMLLTIASHPSAFGEEIETWTYGPPVISAVQAPRGLTVREWRDARIKGVAA